jgi:hypothetical protein
MGFCCSADSVVTNSPAALRLYLQEPLIARVTMATWRQTWLNRRRGFHNALHDKRAPFYRAYDRKQAS